MDAQVCFVNLAAVLLLDWSLQAAVCMWRYAAQRECKSSGSSTKPETKQTPHTIMRNWIDMQRCCQPHVMHCLVHTTRRLARRKARAADCVLPKQEAVALQYQTIQYMFGAEADLSTTLIMCGTVCKLTHKLFRNVGVCLDVACRRICCMRPASNSKQLTEIVA
jgi:hypothetical protein